MMLRTANDNTPFYTQGGILVRVQGPKMSAEAALKSCHSAGGRLKGRALLCMSIKPKVS